MSKSDNEVVTHLLSHLRRQRAGGGAAGVAGVAGVAAVGAGVGSGAG